MPMTHHESVGHVYVVRVGNEIKVGFTTDLDRRLKELKGELITSAPGAWKDEQTVLAACWQFRSTDRIHRSREWFTIDVLPTLEVVWFDTFGEAAA